MSDASDVEMASAGPSTGARSQAEETEMKKALLVYRSNQQSASDDDDDDDDDEEEEEDDEEEDASVGDEDDAASVRSETGSVEMEEDEERRPNLNGNAAGGDNQPPRNEEEDDDDDDDDDEDDDDDDEEDDDEVQVEKDDEESVNAPSDDDLEPTATPPPSQRHGETEEDDDDDMDGGAGDEEDEEDKRPAGHGDEAQKAKPRQAAARDGDSNAAPESSSQTSTAASSTSASGSKLNVEEIIAARRRTGARKECEICREGRNGRRAMLCTNCKCMYHSSCYRKKYNKLITAMGKQWFCPDCEPAMQRSASPDKSKQKKGADDSKAGRGAAMNAKDAARHAGKKGVVLAKGTSGYAAADVGLSSGPTSTDQELSRVTDIAMRGAKKINSLIIERVEEMLFVTKSLSGLVETAMAASQREVAAPAVDSLMQFAGSNNTSQPNALPSLSALGLAVNRSSIGNGNADSLGGMNGHGVHNPQANETLLKAVQEGLFSLKNMLENLQVLGIEFEVDLIKDIKVPPVKDEPKTATTSVAARKTGGSAAARSTGASAGTTAKVKTGASRLYSSKQIQKLEEWYQKSSRPEASEIQAMYRIINSPEYADKELQPDGISVKQIRIWFDNRRAKERLDYMRLKMKDISTADMDAEDVKRMKAAYIDEAKEVLEARVSRLKENGKGVSLIDEADSLLLASSEPPLPTSKSMKASPATKLSGLGALKDPSERTGSLASQKKRIRIDYVASVRRAVKDARDAGKSEEEVKLVKTSAIERARERLHIPYKNARAGPTKPLGKEEVSHVKMTMLKLLEEDAPAEELTDVVELLLSVIIPRDILIESQLHRQLNLVLKAHKDNKELVRQTNRLLDEFNLVIEKGDSVLFEVSSVGGDEDKAKKKKDTSSLLLSVDSETLPDTPGVSPDSPGASPDARKPRVKFSRDQLMKLERHFHKEDTPSKKNLEKLSKKLNEIAARDSACDGQDRIDYKQIRSWFYKRRSTNQPPQALSQADLQAIEAAGTASSSSSASETESDSDDGSQTPASKTGKAKAATPKRKASGDDKPTAASKRMKKSDGAAASAEGSTAKPRAKKEPGTGKPHPGRIFNVKQLATIIEEYEKNPRPSVARLEELQRILNQEDHADENFVNPLGVTKRQVKTWFSNRRAKERLEVMRMKVQSGEAPEKTKSVADTPTSKKAAASKSKKPKADGDESSETEDEEPKAGKKRKTSSSPTAASAGSSPAKKSLFSKHASKAADASDDEDDHSDDEADAGQHHGSDAESRENSDNDDVDMESDDNDDDDDDDDDNVDDDDDE
ncbi:hypothetical protein P43SY_002851 [Pythium insidiosum]|uniref:Homeobox and zinc-finger domain-containing protein n=1 Tax=Pythium insidiosum TaxID=114742 RepID=A0AAD5QCK7_PYTIN|nr:hypothetical protein P43SY_002851 [Pythium insidiosum]